MQVMSAVCNACSQPGSQSGHARLVTIAYSHYVDRVRWILDLSPLRDMYTEDAHPPVLIFNSIVSTNFPSIFCGFLGVGL